MNVNMNNLEHMKNFYPDNYKLDLSETMKAALSKVPGGGAAGVNPATTVGANVGMGAPNVPHADLTQTNPGAGYVTEKLYMLLQLYLQNKGWNPSAELLQCFSDLKDNAMLPSAAYLQVLANRLTLDAQGRLILRENGKIVLPFEHFANAVMLKHMSGPHGLHLSVDATVRAVIESYTIGRDQFGMEKEFIIEVVQSCPSPACRYYKNHMGISPLPFMEQQFPNVSPADFLQHLPHLPPPQATHPLVSAGAPGGAGGSSSTSSSVSSVTSGVGPGGEVDLSKSAPKMPPQLQHLTKQQQNSIQSQLSQLSAAAAAHHQQQQQQLQQQQLQQQQQQLQQQQQQQQQQAAAAAAAAAKHQQQLTAALIQQQNRVLAQQSLEKFSSLSPLEKQRVLAQLDPKHFDPMAVAAAAANLQIQSMMHPSVGAPTNPPAPPPNPVVPLSTGPTNSGTPLPPSAAAVAAAAAAAGMNTHLPHVYNAPLPPPPSPSPSVHNSHSTSSVSSTNTSSNFSSNDQKNIEVLRSSLDTIESNKDLLALHNGAWGSNNPQDPNRPDLSGGQDKIVRVFAELMRNMARMKTYIRPSMCKPYGKQSESLQKTLMDTIQIVQTLRNCLPAPHIPVTSWKSESEGNNGASLGFQGNTLSMNPTSLNTIQASRVEN